MTTKNLGLTSQHRGVNVVYLGVALVWLSAFFAWFNSFGLPNNPGIERPMLWKTLSIPFDVIDLIDPPTVTNGAPWSWLYLSQRAPFFLLAVAIWVGAWGVGSIFLRRLKIRLLGCEHFFFSMCLGLSLVSLLVLALGLCGYLSRWSLILIVTVFVLTELRCLIGEMEASVHSKSNSHHNWRVPSLSRFGWVIGIVLAPFILGQLLGAMSPQTDFDMLAYHLGGPKEWFQSGRITRLPHNVYTNFPFLSEMLILAGMVLYGDWQLGSLAGQCAVAGFAPITAIGLYAAGRRWFSSEAGWIAALVYLTSPWTYRFTIYANAEGGLSCYLFAALYAMLLLRDQFAGGVDSEPRKRSLFAFLAGLMAGNAMACKYTGLVSVVVPIGILLVWIAGGSVRDYRFQLAARNGLIFFMGVCCTIGPWLLKNTIETGNPVYPLAVRIFGGIDRDEAIDAKWRRGHAAATYASWVKRLEDLPVKLTDVVAKNDWHSPLTFGLAPLSLLVCLRRRKESNSDQSETFSQPSLIGIVWVYVTWQFFTWWILTHHIDRFYVPMFSAVSLLAGIGMSWWEPATTNSSIDHNVTIWNRFAGCVIVLSLFYNATLMANNGISGFNAGRMDLTMASNMVVAPRLRWINDEFESGRFPKNTKVLCVGEAGLFHARYPYLYNSVFDHSIFERLCAEPDSIEGKLRPVAEIRDEFKRMGITHIDVNWSWILTYREPGNYGFTEFANPEVFDELQRLGILGPAIKLPTEAAFAALSEKKQKQLNELKWASRLATKVNGEPAYFAAQLFPVINNGE